jgi:hypothetical protein
VHVGLTASCTIRIASKTPTWVGTVRDLTSPVPSCPESLTPHAHTSKVELRRRALPIVSLWPFFATASTSVWKCLR